MDLRKCYYFTKCVPQVDVKTLIENHPDDFYRCIINTKSPIIPLLSYAAYKQDLEIIRAIFRENKKELNALPPKRLSYEYYSKPQEIRPLFKEILQEEPLPNCQVS
jgi:hypothetical protein